MASTTIPGFARLLFAIERKNDHGRTAAAKLVRILEPYALANALQPEPFLSAEMGRLDGPILVGRTCDDTRFGLTLDCLTRPTNVVGGTGTGKSNLIRGVVRDLRDNQIATLHWDRKRDLLWTARIGIVNLDCRTTLRDNPLMLLAPGVPLAAHRDAFVTLFSELFEFMQRGAAIMLQAVDWLYRGGDWYARWPRQERLDRFPTLHDLASVLRSQGFVQSIKGRGKESLWSAQEKLDSLLVGLGPVLSCRRGIDWTRLLARALLPQRLPRFFVPHLPKLPHHVGALALRPLLSRLRTAQYLEHGNDS